MVKNRLIFTLLLENGIYQLSRNFSLQAAGDLAWLKDFYNFKAILNSIDELIVLNVDRQNLSKDKFVQSLLELTENCFMPIAAGGKIRSVEDASLLLRSGADKIVVNYPLFFQPELVRELVETFGSQCVIASVDYKKVGTSVEIFTDCGQTKIQSSLRDCVEMIQELGVGELYLTSISQDGTGYGFDLPTLQEVASYIQIPLIASGGVGKFEHLAEGIKISGANAVATANLFNFIKDGLTVARTHMRDAEIDLACW